MSALYGGMVEQYGPTIQPPLPVERERFTPPKSPRGRGELVVGLSGYTYANHRKGEDLVRGIVASKVGQRVTWMASGRGWPVETRRYSWADMPEFYQGLDVLVCPSRVEGGPLPVLEALACGVSVVVPSGVGIIDELPEIDWIYRYERGDLETMTMALERAVEMRGKVKRDALREAVAGHSVEAFVEAHREGFELLMDGGVDAGWRSQGNQ
jgi:glycosyltransferase involved in cell wall biosynthesis